MKKIDKIVLLSFTGPLVLTFLVVVFILLSRHMLVYFDDIIGKDLGWEVIGKLLFYFAVFMVPVAMPLSILLSSLLAFGNLSEHFELIAIKSAGISLLRAIAPIFFLVLMLTGVAFHANNNLVPKAALEAFSLMYDVKHKKPAMDLREGTFYNGMPNVSIKADRKFPDGITLADIVVYDHQNDDGKADVITADSGLMTTILHEHYLKFELFNGFKYSESPPHGDELARDNSATITLSRSAFYRYQVIFDLSSFNLPITPKQSFAGNRITRNLTQLGKDIDSLGHDLTLRGAKYRKSRPEFFSYFNRADQRRSMSPAQLPLMPTRRKRSTAAAWMDSLYEQAPSSIVVQTATNRARQLWSQYARDRLALEDVRKEKIFFQVQWHKIIANSFMCLAMFLIGAPLGAVIRRGGLGIPFLISIGFFVLYYVLSMQGEKLALRLAVDPVAGVWFCPVIFLVIGFVLLQQARNDARTLETDTYRSIIQRLLHRFSPGVARNKPG